MFESLSENQLVAHYARMFDVFATEELKQQTLSTMQAYKADHPPELCIGFLNGLACAMEVIKTQNSHKDCEENLLALLGAASKTFI